MNCNYSSKSISDRVCVYREMVSELDSQFPNDDRIESLDALVTKLHDKRAPRIHDQVKRELRKQLGRGRDQYRAQAAQIEKTFWYRHADKVTPYIKYAEYSKTGFDVMGNVLASVYGGKAGGAAWGGVVPWIEHGANNLFAASSLNLPTYLSEPSKTWKSVAVESGARAIAGAYLGKSPLRSGTVMATVFGGAQVLDDYLHERPIDVKNAGIHAAIAGVLGFFGHLVGNKVQQHLSRRAERQVEFALTKAESGPLVQQVERAVLKSIKPRPHYKTTPDLRGDIKALAGRELARHEIQFINGKICNAQGRAISTIEDGTHTYVFTMSKDGRIFVAPQALSHANLMINGEVASAGEMVILNGVLLRISNSSGHFQPSEVIFKQVLDELMRKNAKIHSNAVVIIESKLADKAGPLSAYLKRGSDELSESQFDEFFFAFREELPENLKRLVKDGFIDFDSSSFDF